MPKTIVIIDDRPTGPGGDDTVVPVVDAEGQIREIREIESEVIALALRKYQGRMSEIARRLGISRSTLYRKVIDIGLNGAPESL